LPTKEIREVAKATVNLIRKWHDKLAWIESPLDSRGEGISMPTVRVITGTEGLWFKRIGIMKQEVGKGRIRQGERRAP
jgi:hypothetical protein